MVAVSPQALSIMKLWTGNRRVHYIANGIATDAYDRLPARLDARAQLNLPPSSFASIGIVARVTPSKGHRLLIDVFARLQAKIANAELVNCWRRGWPSRGERHKLMPDRVLITR